MKKSILATAALFAAALAFGQDESELSQLKDLGSPKLSAEGASTIVVLGDPQTYTQFAQNQGILRIMTAWTASARDELNIRGVLCTGDLVQYNGTVKSKSKNSDQSNTQMWKAVSDAFGFLDNRLPYVVCTGNHDYGYRWTETRDTLFPQYFNIDRNAKNFEAVVEAAPDFRGIQTLENAAYILDVGGKWGKILVVAVEFSPRPETLAWAKKLLGRDEYKNMRAILLTHSFIDSDGALVSSDRYKAQNSKAADVWETLVSKCPNVKMVVCGHATSDKFDGSSKFAPMKNDAGGNVAVMLFNPQKHGGGYDGNGGDGWLRLLEFQPDGETVKASTYSPLFGISPLTKKLAWRTAACDMFEFKLDR